ncbi:hypothetical protein HDU76_005582 [Blyttiomyces sp. JEL0837]|nr:hypothetical protein HDU76_005582 [Blyttiomyces sp. JEL0837]
MSDFTFLLGELIIPHLRPLDILRAVSTSATSSHCKPWSISSKEARYGLRLLRVCLGRRCEQGAQCHGSYCKRLNIDTGLFICSSCVDHLSTFVKAEMDRETEELLVHARMITYRNRKFCGHLLRQDFIKDGEKVGPIIKKQLVQHVTHEGISIDEYLKSNVIAPLWSLDSRSTKAILTIYDSIGPEAQKERESRKHHGKHYEHYFNTHLGFRVSHKRRMEENRLLSRFDSVIQTSSIQTSNSLRSTMVNLSHGKDCFKEATTLQLAVLQAGLPRETLALFMCDDLRNNRFQTAFLNITGATSSCREALARQIWNECGGSVTIAFRRLFPLESDVDDEAGSIKDLAVKVTEKAEEIKKAYDNIWKVMEKARTLYRSVVRLGRDGVN